MKIVVISDTHGRNDVMWDVLEREAPYDMVIHCGDIEMPLWELRDKIDSALFVVAGNNDYDPDLEMVKTFNIGKYKAMLTHGHRYKVYYGLGPIDYAARENQAEIVFFGHTHVPMILTEGGMTFINPGSLTYPRQKGRIPTYVVMNIDGDKEPSYELKYVQ